jgi:trans-aconitate 2-methyltransferase
MQPAQQKWNAEDYAKNSAEQLRWAQELMAKLALRGCESVLDIGCGDGKVSAQLALAAKGGHVRGIDLSADMIRLASKNYPAAKNPNLSFLQMDAADIRLSEKFDIAFSTAALHWVKDQTAVLRGVHACLKPGGRVLFQMGGRGNAADVLRAIEKIRLAPRWRQCFAGFTPPYHFYGPQEYDAWLRECGFSPVRVELMPKDMRHQGLEGFTGWLRTTWFPYTDPLPAELREAFLTELVEAYTTENPPDRQGLVHVKMVRLEVEAVMPGP